MALILVVGAILCGVPLWLVVREHRRAAATMNDVVTRFEWSPELAGLLCGGPARVADAVTVAMVQRGALHAENGVLRPDDTPPAGPFETTIAHAAAQESGIRLTGLRDRIAVYNTADLARLYQDLHRCGLVVAGTWLRSRGPIAYLLFCMATMIVSTGTIPHLVGGLAPGAEPSPGWLVPMFVIPPLATSILSRLGGRRGGADPRTALGRGCSRWLTDVAGTAGSQAARAATGGLRTMTDPHLRHAIQGDAADSDWSAPVSGVRGLDIPSQVARELIENRADGEVTEPGERRGDAEDGPSSRCPIPPVPRPGPSA